MKGDRTAKRVLLVEDNPGDVRLVTYALAEAQTPCEMDVVNDGSQALDFLHRNGKYAGAPRPAIIFLDLNLPALDGGDVLARVRNDPELKRIPVIVLTSSSAEHDILRSYDLGANCYIIKPFEPDQFIKTIGKTLEFWLKITSLPPF
jgi:chemotaxis family two-component system response regulator Rcp1